jgi:hypothetical protein
VTSSTTGSQGQGTDASTAAADYSRIGPSYETIDSRRQHQPEAGGRGNTAALARLLERYEFSEPHLAMAASARPDGFRCFSHRDQLDSAVQLLNLRSVGLWMACYIITAQRLPNNYTIITS